MRIDANVSVRLAEAPFGTRCEIKNLNSLRSLHRAIDYEAARQVALITSGGTVRQETRHWDEMLAETSTMRVKEEAEDYRYFREPDLVELAPSDQWRDRVAESLGPMPAARRLVLRGLLSGPTGPQIESIDVVVMLDLDAYVLAVHELGGDVTIALARASNEVAASHDRREHLTTSAFAETVLMEQRGELSATQAKKVLGELLTNGGDPAAIARTKGFEQLSDDSLSATVEQFITQHPDEWQRYRDGDEKLAQFFIGLVMKATSGQANGKTVIAELQSRR
jgi:aspartyl-tRNA(Asn)/glutamyl-tRNA(Gln) amidotransferase subunit B